jgi:hypothetical protein
LFGALLALAACEPSFPPSRLAASDAAPFMFDAGPYFPPAREAGPPAPCVGALIPPASTRLLHDINPDFPSSFVNVAADFDGDGDVDFIDSDGDVHLYRNDGLGGSPPETIYSGAILSLAPADFDGDGSLDLIGRPTRQPDTTNRVIELLLNDGHGHFTAVVVGSDAGQPTSARFVDLDGDGKPELIAAWGQRHTDSDTTTVVVHGFRRTGGGFDDRVLLTYDGDPDVTAADLDGDGKPDLVVPVRTDRALLQHVAWNDPSGFALDSTPLANLGRQPVIADLNGDGRPELAAGNIIMRNDGQRHFQGFQLAPSPRDGSGSPTVAADIDGDGDLDLVVRDQDQLLVFRQDGPLRFTMGHWPLPGTWTARGFTSLAEGRLVIANVEGDARPEAIFSDALGRVLLVSADQLAASFAYIDPARSIDVGQPISRLSTTDLNGDGHPDLVTVAGGAPAILVNDGSGRFVTRTFSLGSHTQAGVTAVATGDLDGDGLPDLATVTGDGWLLVFRNHDLLSALPLPLHQALAGFDAAAPLGQLAGLIAADLDGDGDLDLVIGRALGRKDAVLALWNDGHGTFSGPTPVATVSFFLLDVAAADLDGDGRAEVIVGSDDPDADLSILRVRPDSVELAGSYRTGLAPSAIAVADVDGDGAPDLVLGGEDRGRSSLGLLINDGHGQFTAAPGLPARGDISAVTVADVDGDGDRDILASAQVAGEVTLWINDGAGHFSGGGRFVGFLPGDVAVADFDGRCGVDVALVNHAPATIALYLAGGPGP